MDNTDWDARKRAVAHRFHRSSLARRLEAEAGGFDVNCRDRPPTAGDAASGDGFPLMLRSGTLIGTIGMSGLPDVEDHLLAVTAMCKLLA